MTRSFASLLSILIAGGFADAVARGLPVVLTVKPVLCITDRRNPTCEMSLLVAWESEAAGDFCLYSDVAAAAISCWARESSGRIEEARVVERPLTYWLTNGEPGVRVAEATVDVVTTDSEDRRRGRQRRHAWSLL